MKRIVAWAIANSPGMNVLMIAVMVVGGFSLWNMRREVFPAFELELVTITVPYPGATPQDSESPWHGPPSSRQEVRAIP